MSGCRSEARRLFQIIGPTTEKLLSPSRVFVLGTVRTLAWAERSWGRPESVIRHNDGESRTADKKFAKFQVCIILPTGYPEYWRMSGVGEPRYLGSAKECKKVRNLLPGVHPNSSVVRLPLNVRHGSSSFSQSSLSPLASSLTRSVFHSELKTWLFSKSFPP